MIRLQTLVPVEQCPTPVSFQDQLLMLGSCFTDNIGNGLVHCGFSACVNPFGTLYNPISVLNSLRRLSEGRPFTPEECIPLGAGSDLICSFSHHTSFARKTAGEFLEHANASLAESHAFFETCTCLVVTLGTAWCFQANESGAIVSNCLKRDAKEFTRKRLSVEETEAALEEVMQIAGNRKVIFTLSPIRHLKDGAHGNQLSKATLLLAIDHIIAKHPGASYFPAYEILLDELRDYRFYAEDMTHPSAQAVSYLQERFLDWALPAAEHPRLEENIRAYRRSQHREMH